MDKISFVSIDFETLTPELTSACAVGLVKVVDNVIVQKFYSLIKPIPDNRNERNTFVNGITDQMVEHAPTWKELYPLIEHFFESGKIVCHNASSDINILERISAYYGIVLKTCEVLDTYLITKQKLVDACWAVGIDYINRHDPMSDATACANLMLFIVTGHNPAPIVEKTEFKKTFGKEFFKKKELDSEVKKPLDADRVDNKETPFFQKKVVLTGTLQAYPVREEIASILKNYGADINGSISGRTDIVIVGAGAGPSKMKKIEALNEKGGNIRIIYEDELLEIMKNHGMN